MAVVGELNKGFHLKYPQGYEENRKTKYFRCDEFIMMVKSMLKHFNFIKPKQECSNIVDIFVVILHW